MAQMISTDWVQHIWKITVVGAVLTLFGLILPACYSDFGPLDETYMWFFGFWSTTSEYATQSTGWPSDFYVDPYDSRLMIGGAVATVLLFIALILMATASTTGRQGGSNKVAAGTSLFGGILAIIGPVFYYYYLDAEIAYYGVSVHWTFFDQSFGYYLPIIGGIVGIIGGIAASYAFTLESKVTPERVIEKYQPPTKTQVDVQRYRFCANCGAELVGPFCRECGTKA